MALHDCNQKEKIASMDRELGEVSTTMKFVLQSVDEIKLDNSHIKSSVKSIDGKLERRESGFKGALWATARLSGATMFCLTVIGFLIKYKVFAGG